MPAVPLNFDTVAKNPDLAALGADNTFAGLIGSLLSVVMTLSAVLLLLYLVWGAVEWITSAGESSKLQAARNKIMHAVIGVLVLSSVLAIFMFVQYILGISVLKFDFGSGTAGGKTNTTTQGSTGT